MAAPISSLPLVSQTQRQPDLAKFKTLAESSYKAMFPDVPLELTTSLDAMIWRGPFVMESEIVAALSYLSTLDCPSERKVSIVRKITSYFSPTPLLSRCVQQILASPKISTQALDQIIPEQTVKILAQVNQLIENLEEGWVKKRLQQVVRDHQSKSLA